MKQEILWQSDFGKDYTERSILTPDELDADYENEFGVAKSALNKQFLSQLSIDNVLEVGCNVANQLRMLQSSGYDNLYGIELQPYAVERAKGLTKNINIIQGSALEMPFRDQYFDLVFTCGVLIHIAPEDIKLVIREMYRVSKKYIWGFEYFANEHTEINYRGESHAMWKGDFAQMFLDEFSDLKLIKSEKIKYLSSNNFNMMYLLEKV